jgi:hypothetical protein
MIHGRAKKPNAAFLHWQIISPDRALIPLNLRNEAVQRMEKYLA